VAAIHALRLRDGCARLQGQSPVASH
jgi:hypothetical protein